MEKDQRMKNLPPNLAGALAIVGWGASALIVINTGQVPPMLLSAIAAMIGFLSALIYWGVCNEPIREKFKLSAQTYALGVFGICGYTALWLTGLKLAPPFEANALNYIWPLLLVLINTRLDRLALKTGQIVGLFCGLLGSILIFSRYGISTLQTSEVIGLLCSLAGAFVWATYSSMTRFVAFPSSCVAVFLLITSFVCYCLHIAFEEQTPDLLQSANWLFIVLLGVTRVSFIFWDHAMKYGDRQMLGSSSYLIPAFSVLLLGIFGHVEVSNITLFGVCIIVGGCLTANAERIAELIKR